MHPPTLAEIFSHYEHLFKVAYRVVKNTEDAEDVMQNSMIKAISKLDQLEDPDKLKSWLTTLVRNHALRYLRDKKKFVEVDLDSIPAPEVEGNPYADFNEKLKERISELSPKQREVMEMKAGGMKMSQIASQNAPVVKPAP